MKKFGVGVVGLGFGAAHVEAYKENPETEVIAVCDSNKARAKAMAEKYGIQHIYTDYEKMVEQKDLDIISVCTPDAFHAEQSIRALEEGKHVICEKPMTISIESCQRMIRAVEETGLKLMIDQILRFYPMFQTLKDFIENGKLGELFYAEADYIHNLEQLIIGHWREEARNIHTPILGGGCHAMDLIRWLAGEIVEVYAYGNHKVLLSPRSTYPFDDCMVAILKFKNGCVGKVTATFGVKRAYLLNCIVYGTEGSFERARASSDHEKLFLAKGGIENFEEFPVPFPSKKPLNTAINHFIQAIKDDSRLLVDVYEGARTVASCLAVMEAIERGRPVVPHRF